jgi:hypothetical protein
VTTANRRKRAERQLEKLYNDYESIRAELSELGYILPGTLQKREYKCGKPNCRCANEGVFHGPYYQWTRKINGKTVTINFEKEVGEKVKEWTKNNQRFRRISQRLEKTSLDIVQILKELDEADSP